ncbi:Oidioi.mRNA.OKI2018_I69.chr1.g166.t1.cds [Oikopleura dioica]|uniref:Oidioi.mRNA.OKI2018_I69.chr1.g166.t1.cds n=1 Tax=Oikopleura dioica TaxID=34765 RepID=A0ABN7SKR4_OIKDI|nr:Oidioi.mRNA.OKI2018_I69.chr1.g166.t1.cds [Oikopleura dioica]
MKLFLGIVAAVSAQGGSTGGSGYYQPVFRPYYVNECWTCNSTSWEDCQNDGYYDSCMENEQVCEIGVRKRKDGPEQIITGCKWYRACRDNHDQNADYLEKGLPLKEWQCQPHWQGGLNGSVCRQCCNTGKDCGIDFLQREDDGLGPKTYSAWNSYNLINWHEVTGEGPNYPFGVQRDEN